MAEKNINHVWKRECRVKLDTILSNSQWPALLSIDKNNRIRDLKSYISFWKSKVEFSVICNWAAYFWKSPLHETRKDMKDMQMFWTSSREQLTFENHLYM